MVNTILTIALAIIILSIAITIFRFVIGWTTIDRVIAFDIMTISSIAMIGIIAYLSNRIIYLDIALVYGLLSFLAVIIIAKYLEKSL
ncbi:MAG: cation:proton antiporter [Bacteroidetes bacterium 4572_117]|nr:MAG: cation:proton antiporter [Bacteroidetes bacterium 4572_117]